ncbi:MAG TPA: M12 family metallopeptidase [Pyrinomonadaceae bacterium]|nr:M12 family metallopeptidase [Pyrinomonadaceae bacterium]
MKAVLFIHFVLFLSAFGIFSSNAAAQSSQQILKPIPDGYSLIDGDIVMPTNIVQAILKGNKTVLNDLAVQPSTSDATVVNRLWTNGIIPFEFQNTDVLPSNCPNAIPTGSVSNTNRAAIISAMSVLENTAVIHFEQCAGATCPSGSRVLIRDSSNDIIRDSNNNCVDGSQNSSPVGMRGTQNIINITSWTGTSSQAIIMHELLHTLGFYHEQSRADRNTFVTINCNNVQGGCSGTLFTSNFVIEGDGTAFGYYDFDSVMHYGQCAFSSGSNCPTDSTQTITVNQPNTAQWQNAIGQRTHLSTLDAATLLYLYPPNDMIFYDCTYNTLPQIGSFFRPFSQPTTAINNTPVGGTLVVLKECSFPNGTYNRNITIKAAPGVTAGFGN